MIARCDQCPAVYQPFSHSRFLQVALSFCPETSLPLSSLIPTARRLYDLCANFACLPSISPIFLSSCPPPSLSVSRFGSYVYFILPFLHPRGNSSEPPSRRRHQQTSWLYRESRLDYESWLEAGRLAHWSRREVPFFSLSYRTSLNFALELSRSQDCPSLSLVLS